VISKNSTQRQCSVCICAADLQIECKPLKSKRYITDGFCTSIRPVVDFVCTGTCLPIRQLPWYAEFIKVWSHTKTLQYRCVDDDVRHRKVTFACDNGETRSYRIRVVRSCKCKRYMRTQNESPSGSRQHRRRRRRRRRKMTNDWWANNCLSLSLYHSVYSTVDLLPFQPIVPLLGVFRWRGR